MANGGGVRRRLAGVAITLAMAGVLGAATVQAQSALTETIRLAEQGILLCPFTFKAFIMTPTGPSHDPVRDRLSLSIIREVFF